MSYYYIKKTESTDSFFDLLTVEQIRVGVKGGTIQGHWLVTPCIAEMSYEQFVQQYPKASWTSVDALLTQLETEEKKFWPVKNQWARWKEKIVKDESAPMYYSERAIYVFSILFSVLFGSVLLAINLRHTESKKGVWGTAAFGFVYTVLQILALSSIPRSTGLTLVCAIIGAQLMLHFYWKKYIGVNTKYRAKPVWIPLIVGIAITAPFLFIIIHYGVKE